MENKKVYSFLQAVVWETNWTVETVNTQIEKGDINFSLEIQNDNIWSETKKSCFIESLLLGLPVSSIVLAEDKNKKNSYIIVDGEQRLESIKQFYDGSLKLSNLSILKQYEQFKYSDKDSDKNFEELVEALDNQPIQVTIIRNWPDESYLDAVYSRLNCLA